MSLDEQRNLILRLRQCSFLPGSFEKRIVRQWVDGWLDKPLSEKGAACLVKLAHRYRKQLSHIAL